jgi:5'-nucleotidase
MLLNVNIPGGVDPDGYVVTRQGRHTYGYAVVEKVDPRGRKYYWIGGSEYQHQDIPGSDCNAVHLDKRISVTPLHFELTDHGRLADLSGWRLDGFDRHEPDGA